VVEKCSDIADSDGGHCHEEHRISSYVRVEKFDYVMTRYRAFCYQILVLNAHSPPLNTVILLDHLDHIYNLEEGLASTLIQTLLPDQIPDIVFPTGSGFDVVELFRLAYIKNVKCDCHQ
jgi:hypothetical protein